MAHSQKVSIEKPYRPPNILRLYDVTLADYRSAEDVADERLLEIAETGVSSDSGPAPLHEDAHPADKIPRVFTGLEDWPLRTNLRCWQCRFRFDDRPKFVAPFIRLGDNGGIEIGVIGVMCTFNCAELWIRIRYKNTDDLWKLQDYLRIAYFMFTGLRIAQISPAYEHTMLKEYGGPWDEETFWKKMRELDPVGGLRDHTPGSVVPERLRAARALETAAPKPVVKANSVWAVCGLSPTAEDSVSIEATQVSPEVPKPKPTPKSNATKPAAKSAPKPKIPHPPSPPRNDNVEIDEEIIARLLSTDITSLEDVNEFIEYVEGGGNGVGNGVHILVPDDVLDEFL